VNVTKLIALGAFTLFLSPQMLFAQAFGEYGKTVGGAGQRQGNVNQKASRASSHNSNGKSVAEASETWGGALFRPRWSLRRDRLRSIRVKMMRQRK